MKPFTVATSLILVAISFGVYLVGPSYHTATLVTEQSQSFGLVPQVNVTFYIAEPWSTFQAQNAYANITNLVQNQNLTFSVQVLNGTAAISLVSLGRVSNHLFATVVPLQTLTTFPNITHISRSMNIQGAMLVAVSVRNTAIHPIVVSLNGSRTLIVRQPDFRVPFSALFFALSLLVFLHVYWIYKRRDPIVLISEFLERRLIPRSYVEAKRRNRVPMLLIFSLFFIGIIIALECPFLLGSENAAAIQKPVWNLGLDLITRESLATYLAALITMTPLLLFLRVLLVVYEARMIPRIGLESLMKYEKSFGRVGQRRLIMFAILLWSAECYLLWRGENRIFVLWSLLASCCLVFPALVDKILITSFRSVSKEYLAMFDYLLALIGLATFVLAIFPSVVGLVIPFHRWLVTSMTSSVYSVSTTAQYLSESQISTYIKSNLLVLTAFPSFLFWGCRFFAVPLVDEVNRKSYARAAAYDLLTILGVFVFGEFLLSLVEPVGMGSIMQALLLGLVGSQVSYVLGELR